MRRPRALADALTISRIVLSAALLVTKPLSPMFFAIYIVAGLPDMVDGAGVMFALDAVG